MIHENSSGRKKWADYESDSEDGNENGGDEVPDLPADAEDIDEDFDDDKEGDEIGDLLDLSKVVTATVGKKSKPRNLSKKERMELRQKELEDLDSILAEYQKDQAREIEGVTIVEEEVSNVDDGNNVPADNEEQKSKRKKKKRHQKGSSTVEEEASLVNNNGEEPSLVDIGSVLKAREKKKSTKADPSKIALEEALKNSSTKKKKRDKSKFSEGSY